MSFAGALVLAIDGPWTEALEGLLALGVRQALYAAVVFLGVALFLRLVPKASPGLRHALWGLVFLRLVLPPDLASPASLRGAAEATWRALGGASAVAVDAAPATSWIRGAGATPIAAPAEAPAKARPPIVPLLAGIWLLGAVGTGTLLWRKRRRFRRIVAAARPVDDPRILALLAAWKRRLGIRRPVRLLDGEQRVSPFTVGALRPVIFLPRAVLGHRDPRIREAALAHELCHVARWDDPRLLLQGLLHSLFFFHPAVWAAGKRMLEARERLCDRRVLDQGTLDAPSYGRGLLAVLGLHLESSATAPALADPKGHHAMRIRELFSTRPSAWRLRGAALGAAGLALLLLPLAPAADAGSPATKPGAKKAQMVKKKAAVSGQTVPASKQEAIFNNPLPGSKVTSTFGQRPNPYTKKMQHHDGIDLAARNGTPVLAPADALVEVATTSYSGGADHGTVVILSHGKGLKTFYSHLGSLRVKPGTKVVRGTVIATTGETGKTTGPHLHFEVWKGGEAVDPRPFVKGWSHLVASATGTIHSENWDPARNVGRALGLGRALNGEDC